MWGILNEVKCRSSYVENATREKKWTLQTESKAWETYNATAQPYNAHRLPYITVYGGN